MVWSLNLLDCWGSVIQEAVGDTQIWMSSDCMFRVWAESQPTTKHKRLPHIISQMMCCNYYLLSRARYFLHFPWTEKKISRVYWKQSSSLSYSTRLHSQLVCILNSSVIISNLRCVLDAKQPCCWLLYVLIKTPKASFLPQPPQRWHTAAATWVTATSVC